VRPSAPGFGIAQGKGGGAWSAICALQCKWCGVVGAGHAQGKHTSSVGDQSMAGHGNVLVCACQGACGRKGGFIHLMSYRALVVCCTGRAGSHK
jgi:hypothetical protein